LNVVNTQGEAIGYLSYMFKDEEDLYILGQLEEEGEKQNFLDITNHFIDGLKQSILQNKDTEPYVYIHLGGKVLKLEQEEEKEKEN
jgi:hypothetical protein